MVIKKFTRLFLLFLIVIGSCTSVQHISKTDVSYQVMNTDPAVPPDDSVTAMVAPYKAQLDAEMNEVLGNVSVELTKQKPESTLGNWVADVMLETLQQDGQQVDFSIVNYGGLRVPYISAGPLTTGELFELSPFDNMIMIVDVPGLVLDTILQQIAATEGWPVSKGVKLVIKNKMLVSSQISNQPIDPKRIYKVATLDYVANGGDDMKSFIPLSRKQTGKVLRDMLIAYVKKTTASGKEITSSIEGRIINN